MVIDIGLVHLVSFSVNIIEISGVTDQLGLGPFDIIGVGGLTLLDPHNLNENSNTTFYE